TFDSYRELGFHIGRSVFSEAAETLSRWNSQNYLAANMTNQNYQRGNRVLFAQLRREWSHSFQGVEQTYSQAGRDFFQLMAQMRTDDRLRDLSFDLYPELESIRRRMDKSDFSGKELSKQKPEGFQQTAAELHGVDAILDVMEIAWIGLRLDKYHAH